MTERKTLNDVIIKNQNPNGNSQMSFKAQNNTFKTNQDPYGDRKYDSRTLQQINQQNRNLRQLIQRVQKQNLQNPRKKIEKMESGSYNTKKRIEHNAQKIQQLTGIVQQQKQAINIYQKQIEQFERNLLGIMRLDKDIHSKLVNPHTASTLQKNVKNVLIALNSKAPYDKLITMIQNIKV